MALIETRDLWKTYQMGDEQIHALRGVSIQIERGEYVAIMGPSGSGKSTLMNLIGCLDTPSQGTYLLNGKEVSQMNDNELARIRNEEIGFVFQTFNLLPRATALHNVELPLVYAGIAKKDRLERAKVALEKVELTSRMSHRPNELSGGQRQRVAMGRAIVREPQAFLMDEPLSNLDAKLRVEMRAEIARIQRDLQATTIYVTHDQVEAMTLGDRVVVLRDGYLQQVGTPKALYERPVNLFVAEFIGSPAMNLVGADIVKDNGTLRAVFGANSLSVEARPELGPYAGRRVILGIRPEDLDDASVTGRGDAGTITAVVDIREDLGSEIFVHFGVEAPPVRGRDVEAALGEEALEATSDQVRRKGSLFTARVSRESHSREGDALELAVDASRLHFFDTESGTAIG
jgi:multiple sugar transport system ATP-binding protein